MEGSLGLLLENKELLGTENTSSLELLETNVVKKRRSFTIDQKLEVVKYAKTTSRNAASRKFQIARHCISQWLKNELELENLQASSSSETPAKRRRPGAGRHVKNEELDDKLGEWVHQELLANRSITRNLIQDKALQMYQQHKKEGGREFKASTGWLEKFLLRHKLKSRREAGINGNIATISEQKRGSKDDTPNLATFIQNLQKKKEYDTVYVAYKTVILVDAFGTLCTNRFENEFSSSTDEGKLQVTIILTARSDGHKFQPFVILPQDTLNSSAQQTFQEKLNLAWSEYGLDEKTLIQYLKSVFDDKQELDSKRLILWNKFGCQLDDELNEFLEKRQIENILILSNFNGILQKLDNCLDDQFKNSLLEQHKNWTINGGRETTFNGNLGPLSMNLFLNWIHFAWQSIQEDTISSLFHNSKSVNQDFSTFSNDDSLIFEDIPQIGGTSFLDKIIEEVNQELANSGDNLNKFIGDSNAVNLL